MSVHRPQVLAVDDDRDLLALTCAILGPETEVTCVSETITALRLICSQSFDALITDLHVQHGGDGLLLAVAMRNLQPSASTFLITGYPDFTRALADMQATIDLVLTKPVDAHTLRRLAHTGASATGRRAPATGLSLWELMAKRKDLILHSWLTLVEQDAILRQAPMCSPDRMDHMGGILEQITSPGSGAKQQHASSVEHGRERWRENYRPEWVAREISFLRRTIFEAVLRELISLDLSRLTQDLFEMDSRLDTSMFDSLRSFGLLAA